MNSKNILRLTILCAITTTCFLPAFAAPASNPAGQGPGIAIGNGSNAQRDGVVAIGKNAHSDYAGGSGYANVNGDIAIGENATTHSYYDQSGSVAIGKNSYVENTVGKQDKLFAFNQTSFNSWGFGSLPQNPDKVITGVAIGDNTYVRSGGTMIGSHNYRGQIGDITVNTDSYNTKRKAGLGIYSTTIGGNSFTNGTVATNSGALNVISSDYDGNDADKATKNFGATINGTLNSIESATSTDNHAGIANAIVGTANRTANSNGTLVFGAGNEITNSITAINTSSMSGSSFGGPASVTAMSNNIRAAVKNSKYGGATLAIGGGNKADYTLRTSMIGVNNTVTGTATSSASDNFIVGYNNTASNVVGTTIIGTNRTATGTQNSIIIGSSTNPTTTNVNNIVAIGTNSNVVVEGGIALGANSIANRGISESSGYDWSINGPSSNTNSTWKPTAAAISIGNDTSITRRITSLAAGIEDTDAVNVAQLKQIVNNSNTQTNIINSRINKLDNRINKVGAGAAALAALHPLDFDPNAKWDFAAGYGNYLGSNAAAIGAYYRPNKDIMFSMASSLGNGNNMINAGISIKLGGEKASSPANTNLNKEIQDLKQEVSELKALLGLNPNTNIKDVNSKKVSTDIASKR